MNENSKPKTSSSDAWLRDAADQLAEAGITTARLDAEIILAHTVRKSRTWLHAHGDEELSLRLIEIADARLDLRLDRTPIAYIVGHKEFYTRSFKVTPSVLIPRPESESIIELLKKHTPTNAKRLIDVGTGSGCLGITAKLEFPELNVTLADISRHALKVAESNATSLHTEVTLAQSNLLAQAPGIFDIVIANLPYVDKDWERSPETDQEPSLALFADNGGLALIEQLLAELPEALNPSGLALLEADPCQHEAIISLAAKLGLKHVETEGYAVALVKD
jgi:release factor glutamine methyltransferase